jgi:acyl dehydratase
MSTIHFQDADALQTLVSAEFGDWSQSVAIDQKIINDFADLTGDHQWIHVDEERCAKESPFDTTIAHGFRTLTLMPKMSGGWQDFLGSIGGWSIILNYGSNKLRFTGAVPVNSEIHQRSRLKAVEVQEHRTTLTLETNIHVVGQDERPAVVYELMMVLM